MIECQVGKNAYVRLTSGEDVYIRIDSMEPEGIWGRTIEIQPVTNTLGGVIILPWSSISVVRISRE